MPLAGCGVRVFLVRHWRGEGTVDGEAGSGLERVI
jgi:hypothetical protein